MNFKKTNLIYFLIIPIILIGLVVYIFRPNNNVQDEVVESNTITYNPESQNLVPLPEKTNPLPLIGFEIDKPFEYKVNLLEYSVNQFQEKQTFRILLKNNSNILVQRTVNLIAESETGADNRIREVINAGNDQVDKSEKFVLDDTPLMALSTNPMKYYIVEEENRLQDNLNSPNEHIFELDIFSDESVDNITKTTMVVELKGILNDQLEQDLDKLIEVVRSLRQTEALFSKNSNSHIPSKNQLENSNYSNSGDSNSENIRSLSPFGGIYNDSAI